MAETPYPTYTLADLPKPEGGEKLYAVIGDPVAHSLSPQMHNAAFKALGLNSRYVKIRLTPEELVPGVEKMKAYGYSGWNVTVPHKTAMYNIVDVPKPSAQEAEAVNTVINQGTFLEGESTDGEGFEMGVRETFDLELSQKRVFLLGAGGSAQSLLKLLISRGCSIFLWNRTREKAFDLREFAYAFPHRAVLPKQDRSVICDVVVTPKEIAHAFAESVLIVNATTQGRKTNDPSPLSFPENLSNKYVSDINYITPESHPPQAAESRFLQEAKVSGAQTMNGLSMLFWQGYKSFILWHQNMLTEEKMTLARHAMRHALEDATGQKLPERSAA